MALAVFSTAMYYVWFNYSDAFVENPFTAWSVESDAVLAFALGFYLFRLLSRISSPAYHLPQLSTVVYHLVMVVTILYCLVRVDRSVVLMARRLGSIVVLMRCDLNQIAREMAVFAGAFLSQEIVTANMAASSLMKSSKYTLQKWYFRNQVMLLWLWGIVRLVIDARVLIMLLSYRIEMWASLSAIMVALLCSRVAFQVYYDLLAMWGAWLATMHELEKVTAIRKSNAELY